MICHDVSLPDASDSVFARAARDDLLGACPSLGLRPEWLDALSQGLATYCRQRYPSGCLPLVVYGFLLARVLRMVGEPAAAQRVHARFAFEGRGWAAGAWHAGMPAPGVERLAAYQQAGLLRSGTWTSQGARPGVVLDLNRLDHGDEPVLAMSFFLVLRRLIEQLMPVWSAAQGAGWLGLKGMDRHIRELATTVNSQRQLRNELVDYCTEALRLGAIRRGWQHTPDLMLLELAAGHA